MWDPLPQDLATQFQALSGHAERPEYCCCADLDSTGQYASDAFVAVSNLRVVAFDRHGPPLHLLLSDITEIKVDELFGASRLVAVTGSAEHCLAKYTRNRVAEFSVLCRVIDDLRQDRQPILPETIDRAVCERCQAPLPERGGTCPLCLSRRAVAWRLFSVIRPYRWHATMLTLCASLAVACAMLPPYTYKMITDGVISDGLHDQLLWWVGLMLAAFLCEGAFRFLTNWVNAWLGARIIADMRAALHAKVQRLKMSYHNKHESGELIGRVMHDTGELQHFLVDGLPYFLVNLLSSVTIAVILLSLNWKLALLVFMPVPLLVVGGSLFWRHLRPMFHKHGNRIGVLHTFLSESLNGVRAVKGMAQEQRRAREFDHANERLFSVNTNLDRVFSCFFSTMGMAMAAGTVLVWYFGSRTIIGGSSGMGIGTLVAFAGYMAVFYGPLQWFSAVFSWMSNALTAAERIFAVLDQPTESYATTAGKKLKQVNGHIHFQDIRFSYERGSEVIKGITLDIDAGSMIGLVGKSGAGKSTMINLLCRFYDPDSGAITVDGHDLKDLDLEDWRRHIGIVMQDPFLFNASIFENIRYGLQSASLDDVIEAAKKAQAHGFICQKEEGYDMIIGDGGSSLSGGERQRLAIARAILHDPPVLILDEATSAVDSETEKLIQEAIANLVQGRTTIAIAHRLATLRNANELVVIEDGKIIEQGSHETLMAKEDGHFAKLVNLQLEINKLRAEQNSWQE